MATQPSTFITIIDTTSVAAGDAVFAAIQNGEAAFLNVLPKGDQFAVLGYAAHPAAIYPPSGLAHADAASVAKATKALMDVSPAGDAADIAAAVGHAASLIPRGARTLLAGRNEATPPISSAANKPGQGCASQIDTIGAGDHPPTAVLRAVSAATGGSYRAIAGAAEVEAFFFKGIEQTGTVLFEGTRNLSVSPVFGTASTDGGLVLAALWTADGPPADLPFTISIVQPNEEPWTKPPTYANGGFVIFNLRDAEKGEWTFTFKQKDDAPAATVHVLALTR